MNNVLIIAKKLQNIWKKVYIVWWYCRDKILFGGSHHEIDLATDATPDQIKENLNVVWEIWKKYWTSIIKQANQTFEITTFRKDLGSINNRKPVKVEFTDSLEEDAQRRDFTFNAIYIDPISEKYIDPVWGVYDLKNKIIRFIWNIEDRINEDALRILRFVRFKNKYTLTPHDEKYFDILKRNIYLLENISMERIKEELDKILLWKNNIHALEDLKKIWFFKIFIPEIENQEKTPGSKYHQEGNVWIHTKMTLWILNTVRKREKLSDEYILDLYRTMLFHDIAKPQCFSTDKEGNNHYYGHEREGAALFKTRISKQFKFSKTSSIKIHWLIENHLKVFKIKEMKPLKAKKLMMHKYFDDLLIVWESDHMGRIPASIWILDELKETYKEFKHSLKSKKFFTWKDIIKKYPHLKWAAIWQKLKEENDLILLAD